MAMDAQAAFNEYVAWYLWAVATVGEDAVACHAAATAALGALSAGADRDAAAIEAGAAAQSGAALQATRASYGPNHRYVDWFVWARSELRLPEARCHEAARAALSALAGGSGEQTARDAAIRRLLPPPVEQTRASLSVKPDAPPPSADLPAVAAMLTHGVSMRWEAAVVATMLDLAVRGHVRLVMEPAGLRCKVPTLPVEERLSEFEHIVLQLAVHGAPAPALVPDYQDEDGNRWFMAFDKAVMDEAHAAGLLLAKHGRGRIHWSLASDRWPDATDAGQAVARRWRDLREALVAAPQPPQLPSPGSSIDDPMLAWAVALGVAPEILHAMLPAAAWSVMGGRWRQVMVPSIWARPAKGMAPRWDLRGSWYERNSVTGRVIRRWTESGYVGDGGYYTHYYLAVDDGVGAEAHVWRVNATLYREFPRDTDVRVTVDHKQRLVEIARTM